MGGLFSGMLTLCKTGLAFVSGIFSQVFEIGFFPAILLVGFFICFLFKANRKSR